MAPTLCVWADAGGNDGQPHDRVPMQVDGRIILTSEDIAGLSQEQLTELMGADLPWSRMAAAAVLAKQGRSALPIFVQALSDEDWRVARAGLDGLGFLLDDAIKAKDEELLKAVAQTVESLRKVLVHEHYYVRAGALDVLGKLGKDAAPAAAEVCKLFVDEDFMTVAPKAIKTVATIGVEQIADDEWMKALGQAVRSEDESVRRAAVDVLAKLDEAQQRTLIPDLLDALRTPMKDGYTRFHLQAKIANLLYDLGEEQVLPLSIAILAQKGWGHSHRVEQFVPILEKFGPKAVSALPMLEDYLKRVKGKPEVRLPSPAENLLVRAIAAIKGENIK